MAFKSTTFPGIKDNNFQVAPLTCTGKSLGKISCVQVKQVSGIALLIQEKKKQHKHRDTILPATI